jgi:hypothetical protein
LGLLAFTYCTFNTIELTFCVVSTCEEAPRNADQLEQRTDGFMKFESTRRTVSDSTVSAWTVANFSAQVSFNDAVG